MNNAFESHWEELFVPYPIVNGKKVAFLRHNNWLESSHRRTRKAIRERTGRSETNSEMEQFGDCEAFLINFFFKKRMGILEDFISVLESAKSSDELVDTLQSIGPRLRGG